MFYNLQCIVSIKLLLFLQPLLMKSQHTEIKKTPSSQEVNWVFVSLSYFINGFTILTPSTICSLFKSSVYKILHLDSIAADKINESQNEN